MKIKVLILGVVLACTALDLSAQNTKDTTGEYVVVAHDYEMKTLFGGSHTNGFYISYDLGVGNPNKMHIVETGGRMVWIIDHGIGLGLFGTGLLSASDFIAKINTIDSRISVGGGYGGFMFEPIIRPMSSIHVTTPVMLGVGGAGISSSLVSPQNNGDGFLVLKPGVEIEFNVLRHFRMGLGLQYRYVYGLNLDGLDNDDLNGFNCNIVFKVGKF
jgi:hypothetical protein